MKKLLFIFSSLLFANQAYADSNPWNGPWDRCDGIAVVTCSSCTANPKGYGCLTSKSCTWVLGIRHKCSCSGKCDE